MSAPKQPELEFGWRYFCSGLVVAMGPEDAVEIEARAQFLDQAVVGIETGGDFGLQLRRCFCMGRCGDAIRLRLPVCQEFAAGRLQPGRFNGATAAANRLVLVDAVGATWQVKERHRIALRHVDRAQQT